MASFPYLKNVGTLDYSIGTIIRATLPTMLEFRKRWRCTKCKYKFTVDAEAEQDFSIIKPGICPNPDLCVGKNFTLISESINPNWCRDYQDVKVQEQVQNLNVGTMPRSMWVILENDLVDSCQPGNDVIISGVIRTRWKRLVKGCRSEIELVLMAHNVEVKNSNVVLGTVPESSLKEFEEFWLHYQCNPLRGRDFILSCLCPQVFGLYIVKLAVALVLAGGVQRIDNNSIIRGDTHLLLIGDPGTGKSQFLKYASKISRRSVLTSGIGTTNAGLTAAAVKDGGKWQLEAGALVLADGGICCIDEFNSIKEHDKASIHEAMEQQTISVAKAGLVCKLNTQCSILATTNPKGKYNKSESLSVNAAMASPLLSRFDIILVLLDTYDENWDHMVSSYILEGKGISLERGTETPWSMAKMRAYFSAIKNIKPILTSGCDRVLKAYYRKHRSSEGRSAARTTPRLLQSLIRLAQGHARLMFRMNVLVIDAIVSITIMESSMIGFSIFEGIDALHTTFPDDPDLDYKKRVKSILTILELEDLIDEELSSQIDNGDQMISDAQMDPYFCLSNPNKEVSFNQNINNSTPICSKKSKALITNELNDSSDITLLNVDPFENTGDEFSENIFEPTLESVEQNGQNSEWPNLFLDAVNQSITHFSPCIVSTQQAVSSSEQMTDNCNERPIMSETVNKTIESYETEHQVHTVSKRSMEMTSEKSLQNKKRCIVDFYNPFDFDEHCTSISKHSFRIKNTMEESNGKLCKQLSPDNVSTASEVNAIFSSHVLNTNNKERILNMNSETENRSNEIGNVLNTLDSFICKPKQPLKTLSSQANVNKNINKENITGQQIKRSSQMLLEMMKQAHDNKNLSDSDND